MHFCLFVCLLRDLDVIFLTTDSIALVTLDLVRFSLLKSVSLNFIFPGIFYFIFEIYWNKAVHRFFLTSTGSTVLLLFFYYCLFVLYLLFS